MHRIAWCLVVRASGDPASLSAAVVQRIRSVDIEQPVYDVRTLEQWRDRSLRQRRLTTGLISVFGVTSLLLALLGVYGVLSYTAAARMREFGIRIALGATNESIMRLILKHAFRLAGFGILAGAALAVPALSLIRSLLFEAGTRNNLVLTVAPLLLLAAALVAGSLPALRAMRTAPSAALRHE